MTETCATCRAWIVGNFLKHRHPGWGECTKCPFWWDGPCGDTEAKFGRNGSTFFTHKTFSCNQWEGRVVEPSRVGAEGI